MAGMQDIFDRIRYKIGQECVWNSDLYGMGVGKVIGFGVTNAGQVLLMLECKGSNGEWATPGMMFTMQLEEHVRPVINGKIAPESYDGETNSRVSRLP